MIEEVIIYKCPFCKAEYRSKELAEKCVVNHKAPKEIKDWKYNEENEYPEEIIVSFGIDGRNCIYKKDHFVFESKFDNDNNP